MNRNRQSLRRALQTEVAERKRIEEQLRVLTNALEHGCQCHRDYRPHRRDPIG